MTTIVRRNEALSVPSEPGFSAANVWHLADRTTALRQGVTSLLGQTEFRNQRPTFPTTDAEGVAGAYAFLQPPRGRIHVIPEPRTQSFASHAENWENAVERVAVWAFDGSAVQCAAHAAWVTRLTERAKKARAEFTALVRQRIPVGVSSAEPHEVVDWDFRIESPPMRQTREIRMRFVQVGKQTPRIRVDPEE